ncbi:MAG: class I SAM-dependent rRNA methyltransferase, partial [Firmicutes bacterium]|nr:class I SAM-dependent rRNA methyltransferase [Candidatus Caballimonas caccae]
SKIEGKGKNGELACVYDFNGNFTGKGFINHLSKILVQLFIKDENQEFTKEFVIEKIKRANEYRKKLGYDNSYRAFFGNADGLPSLIVDKYADILVVQIQSLGMQKNKQTIIEALIEVFNPKGIYERSDASIMEKEGLKPIKEKIYGDFDTKVEIEENGLKLLIDVENGQKTGYFLDQKENRFAIRKYANSGVVLDCFCNAGGFALNSAIAGAKEVYALDISPLATEQVLINAKLNNLEKVVKPLTCDVFDKLREYKSEGKEFDTIILDPPAFCKSVSEVNDALKGYKDINLLAMKLVKKGGFLISSSCTHFVSNQSFLNMLKECSIMTGRKAK